jgi:ABC-type uncharacterized transport system auxiliary subunit
MPVSYNKELDTWEAKDLTEEEKDVLIKMACAFIGDQLGAQLADRIVEKFQQSQMLNTVPKEMMGTA